MRIIKDNEELKSLIDENNNIIISDNLYCDFDIVVNANINAYDIDARDIKAWDINAYDIDAKDIYACDIHAGDIYACDIKALNINAYDIHAGDIYAWDIKAWDIHAKDIIYYAVCYAYRNIECKSIKGRRPNCKHFVLEGKIIKRNKFRRL